MSRRTYLLVAGAIVALLVTSAFLARSRKVEVKVFHAGSLTLALKEVEEAYEQLNPGVDVVREPSGSVMAARKVSDLGKACDLLLVADYRVIEEYLMPEHASWYVVFCSNELVLAYTERSRYASEISEENWVDILLRPDVRVGFSNPNLDPCGYRALAALYLASELYGREELWRELVLKHIPNVKVVANESGCYILFPAHPDFRAGGRLVMRDKSVDLIQLLEAGTLNYAFEYRSVAEERGLKYVRLPPLLSLLRDPFLKTFVVLYSGDPRRERRIEIRRIEYGLTIPKSCRSCSEALKLVKWLLYGEGKRILEEHGFTLLPYRFIGQVPKEIRG